MDGTQDMFEFTVDLPPTLASAFNLTPIRTDVISPLSLLSMIVSPSAKDSYLHPVLPERLTGIPLMTVGPHVVHAPGMEPLYEIKDMVENR